MFQITPEFKMKWDIKKKGKKDCFKSLVSRGLNIFKILN